MLKIRPVQASVNEPRYTIEKGFPYHRVQEAEGKQELPPLSGFHSLEPLLVHYDCVRPEDASLQARRWFVGDLCFNRLKKVFIHSSLIVRLSSVLWHGVLAVAALPRPFTTVLIALSRKMSDIIRHT